VSDDTFRGMKRCSIRSHQRICTLNQDIKSNLSESLSKQWSALGIPSFS